MTQAQVVEAMGTTQAVIARLEGGRGKPSTRTLKRFAKATGTRLRIRSSPTAPTHAPPSVIPDPFEKHPIHAVLQGCFILRLFQRDVHATTPQSANLKGLMAMCTLLTYSRFVTAVAMLAALSTATSVDAAQCTANQINGRWALYADYGEGDWSQCLISIRQRRNLSGRCTVSEFGDITRRSVGGILTLNRACVLNGGFFGGAKITGTLQSDAQGGAGILGPDAAGQGIHFTLIRRP